MGGYADQYVYVGGGSVSAIQMTYSLGTYSGHPTLKTPTIYWEESNAWTGWPKRLGKLTLGSEAEGDWAVCPIAGVLTAFLPLAIGPFIAFRFRLWHYLAFTAQVAVELAYYLRWQE